MNGTHRKEEARYAVLAFHHVPDCHTGCCRRCAYPDVPLLMTLRVVTEGIATLASEILGTVPIGFRSSVPYHEECPARRSCNPIDEPGFEHGSGRRRRCQGR